MQPASYLRALGSCYAVAYTGYSAPVMGLTVKGAPSVLEHPSTTEGGSHAHETCRPVQATPGVAGRGRGPMTLVDSGVASGSSCPAGRGFYRFENLSLDAAT